MKRGGCKFGSSKTGAVLCPKKGGCSFTIGTQAQRVSVPPPQPPGHKVSNLEENVRPRLNHNVYTTHFPLFWVWKVSLSL